MTAQPERPLDEGGVRMPKLAADLRVVDADSHMTELSETDSPQPTCLHPNLVEMVSEQVASLRPETQRKIMGENAVKLYRLSPTGA